MTKSQLSLILFLVHSFFFVFATPSSHAKILDYFKKDLSKVPTKEQLNAQEPLAKKKLAQALNYEKNGMNSKAASQYQYIVKNYPFTSSAPTSQFKIKSLLHKSNSSPIRHCAFCTRTEQQT
jgi:hypothetical protein